MYDAVSNTAEVVAAVLGIAVTVVAIIVQLAATRFNHRISTLFAREPVNILVLSFFVLTAVLCVWVSATTSEGSHPDLHRFVMVMVTLSLLALLPYFAYVFSFISPLNVIARIKRQALKQLRACTGRFDEARRLRAARTVDELQDVLRGAIDASDRDIAMACVDALTDLLETYTTLRSQLPVEWHRMSDALSADPDFVSLEDSAIQRINAQSLWFEYKIFSQLHATVDLVIPRLRDVTNLVSIRTRQVAVKAADHNPDLLSLSLIAFNSYLRATIRARDPRTAYYVLSQYRQTAEVLACKGCDDQVLEITRRLSFYAQISFEAGQPFILEVCAYDLVQLLEHCTEEQAAQVDAILDALLALDRPFRDDQQAATVAGVRRAQLRAAATLLQAGDDARADRVIVDLATETQLNVIELLDALARETESEYWELTPRGVNFGYLEPEQRAHLAEVRDRLSALSRR